ncbi:MAG: cell division protein ZapE [Alphaproteobacteria bacterium]
MQGARSSPLGPAAAYQVRLAAGLVAPDPAQAAAVEVLQKLSLALVNYRPLKAKGILSLISKVSSTPQGLYLYGGVGRGKSMLMDLFFAETPVHPKRRVHFHAFMEEVHDRIHGWRNKNSGDPIIPLAKKVAEEAILLCFDEFHITNIADAMILGRFFSALWEQGVVIVATSNWPPQTLYKGGLQRDRFLPFIDLLLQHMQTFHLQSVRDYRLQRYQNIRSYYTPCGPQADRALKEAFANLTDGAHGHQEEISHHGRKIIIPYAAQGVAFCDFKDLCARALGGTDFLALARHYHTLILSGIPRFHERQEDEVRRFMTLIDVLYESHVNIIVSAEAPPNNLMPPQRLAFEFQRTVSRLMEMQSVEYIAAPHNPMAI